MAINFLNNIDLNKNQLFKAVIENQPNNTSAGTGSEGQLYYDTTLDVLKVWANGAWAEVGGGVTTLTTTDSTFIDLTPNTATSGAVTVTAALSATGTPDNTKYLRGDNTWSPTSGISGTTYDLDSIQAGSDVAITLVGSDATVDTVTLVAGTNITLTDDGSANITIDASNPDQTVTLTGDVTGTGTTAITTTISAGAVDFAMINPAAVITSGEGLATNDNDTSWPTSAAVIDYVSAAVVGGLVYKGGYNAATNTPNLDSTPIAGIKTGWTYTVTADGLFFTEQVRVGDVLIANRNSPTTLADWTTVQNNIDVATLSTVGIGNVNAGTGVGVAYSNGTATVTNTDLGSSQNIFKNVAVSGQSTVVADSNNDTLTLAAGSNISITTNAATDTVTIANTYVAPTTSYATTITATATVTHNLGTLDVIVQLYDTVTNDTVYADVTRASTNTVTVTFSAAPLNAVRVLVQK